MKMTTKRFLSGLATMAVLAALYSIGLHAQLQQSGGPGSTVTVGTALPAGTNLLGKFGIDQTTPGTTNGVQINAALPAGSNVLGHVILDSGTVTTVTGITNALPAGTNLLGVIKQRPIGCTAAGTSDVVHDTVGVAVSTGTSVSAATGCVEECYVTNITNAAVTFRLADKTGTPIIWVGGNADFSIPANSNMGCGGNGGLNIAGITFTSGITAIAGTASALNLHIVTRE